MSDKNKTYKVTVKNKSNSRLVKTIAIVASLVVIASTLVFAFTFKPRTVVNVAASTDVIAYFDGNGVTEYLNKKLRVRIRWMDYGTEDIMEKLKADMSSLESGARVTLPDAYLGLGLYTDEMRIVSNQLFLDITNIAYTSNSAINYRTVLERNPTMRSRLSVDGKIYSFPSLYEDYASRYPQKVWVNSQWLQNLGIGMPQTTDEFYEMLKRFKEDDPNKNGEKDEMPLGGAYSGMGYNNLGFLINAFVASDYDLSDNANYFNVDNNGRVYTAVTDPKFKDALVYLQRLMEEGLIAKDIFQTSADALLEGSITAEKYGVIAAPDINGIFGNEDRASVYEPMPPLNGGNQATIVLPRNVQGGGYMIGKETKVMDKALAIGDTLLSMEGTLTLFHGVKGGDWNVADANRQGMGGDDAVWKLNKNDNAITPPFGDIKGAVPFWYSTEIAMSQQAMANEAGEVNLQSNINWKGYLNKITYDLYEPVGRINENASLPEIVFSPEEEIMLSKDGNMRAEIYDYLTATCREFVTGKLDIEEHWDGYVQTLSEKGLEQFLELTQRAYDRAQP